MLRDRVMHRTLALAATLTIAACGSDPLPILNPGEQMMNPPMMNDPMNPAINGPSLADRTFELTEGTVFGVSSPLRVTVGAMSGTPAQATFEIRSLANSDEANGMITAQPCAFTVASSSFPGNARLQAGARLELQCAVDVNAGTVRLTDPATNMFSEGTLCTVADEEVSCGAD